MTYDQWKTRSPDDEWEEQQRRMQSEEDFYDQADRLYQAYKDGDLDRPDIDQVRRRNEDH